MDGPLRRHRLDVRHRGGIDDIHSAWCLGDSDVDALAVLANGHVIGMPTELDLLDDFKRLSVNDVERALCFVTDIQAAAVRGQACPMWHLDPLDLSNDL